MMSILSHICTVFVLILATSTYAQDNAVQLHASLVKDTVDEYERIWVNLEIQNDSEYDIAVLDFEMIQRRRLNRIASVQDSLKRELPFKRQSVFTGFQFLVEKQNSVTYTMHLHGYGATTFLGQYLPPGRFNIRLDLHYSIDNEKYNGPPFQMFDDVQVVVREIDKIEKDKYLELSDYCAKLEVECYRPATQTKKQREEYDNYGSERRQRDYDSLRYLQIKALRNYFTNAAPSDLDYDITRAIVPKGTVRIFV